MTAFLLPVLLLACAFVVDLGLQRVARADAQALADIVALDLARELDGREISPAYQSAMEAAAAVSLARNGSVVGGDDHTPVLDVRLGALDADGDFSPMASGIPTAVQVVADTGVDFAFAGMTGQGSGTASRSAVGVSDSAACFQLGSWAATLEPGAAPLFEDLLGQVLGKSVVKAGGWDGLATSNLALADIIAADSISVGTVDGLLSLPGLTAGEVYLAMADVLRADGAIAQADVLDAAAVSAIGDVVIDAGELFALSTATDAALATEFNALDLLIGTAFLANGENFFALKPLQAAIPHVGVTSAELSIIENPRRACNQDTAETAQVKLDALAKLAMSTSLLKINKLVDLKLVDNTIDLAIDIDLAGAQGTLTDYSCDPATFEADVWRDLVTLRLSGNVVVEGGVSVSVLGLPKLVEVPVRFELDLEADGSRAAGTPAHVGPVSYPPQAWGDPVKVGGEDLALPYVTVNRVDGSLDLDPVKVGPISIPVDVLEPLVDGVLDGLMGTIRSEFVIVNPLIDKLNGIVGPLSTGIGLSTAGADFFGLPTPTCQQPALRG
ncbi:hypothetical protein KUV85_02580 [Nocardioides panacisoli]|nr:hypothetical protein [Nocardioides panacisoli]QYJ04583.1 hypothetical protein KUV85_02580 [Nocardioides panacisoli]